MPIRPPALDDRSFEDLRAELIARIPAHTPEWTNPRQGDPGVTLIELFAWLADTILYRANLIPERQRLVFLSLLGQNPLPARAARGLASLSIEQPKPAPVTLAAGASIKGPVTFETIAPAPVLPVTGEVYRKRPLTAAERRSMSDFINGLRDLYGLQRAPKPYVTLQAFAGGLAEPAGIDVARDTVDGCLWIALLRSEDAAPSDVLDALSSPINGATPRLALGFAPRIDVPDPVSGPALVPRRVAFVCESARLRRGRMEFIRLEQLSDTTQGLTREGVIQFSMPPAGILNTPANDVTQDLQAGVGERPPRIEDPEKGKLLTGWLRLRPTVPVESLGVSWLGINAVEIDQYRTITGRVIGTSTGAADQEFALPAQSIDPSSFRLFVEEPEGFREWARVDDLTTTSARDGAYTLDAQAGLVRFGDGLRGRVPVAGARIRVATMRTGGGRAGNLPAGTLQQIEGTDLEGGRVNGLKLIQPTATHGGEDAETFAGAERRIPAMLRHRDRAVTASDYRDIALAAPGVTPGRIEILEGFLPQQRRSGVAGVVTLMALPAQAPFAPPNPRADRPFLEAIDRHVAERKPLGSELHVIGCQYIGIGLAVGVTLRDGFDRDRVLLDIRQALRAWLWPLAPGGSDGNGWILGRSVRAREADVVVARVAGIDTVAGVSLFTRIVDEDWRAAGESIALERWQLPELLGIAIATNGSVPADPGEVEGQGGGSGDIAVPLIPEVC